LKFDVLASGVHRSSIIYHLKETTDRWRISSSLLHWLCDETASISL